MAVPQLLRLKVRFWCVLLKGRRKMHSSPIPDMQDLNTAIRRIWTKGFAVQNSVLAVFFGFRKKDPADANTFLFESNELVPPICSQKCDVRTSKTKGVMWMWLIILPINDEALNVMIHTFIRIYPLNDSFIHLNIHCSVTFIPWSASLN